MACLVLQAVDWRTAPPLSLTDAGCSGGTILSGVNLGDVGACAIARALLSMGRSGPERIYLCNNGISDEGAEAIAAALASGTVKVKRLYLEGNLISDAGARAISAVLLSDHTTLREIDLRNNKLSGPCKLELRSPWCQQRIRVDWSLPSPTYMEEVQSDISNKMRTILFD